jgi:hypothetical protein
MAAASTTKNTGDLMDHGHDGWMIIGGRGQILLPTKVTLVISGKVTYTDLGFSDLIGRNMLRKRRLDIFAPISELEHQEEPIVGHGREFNDITLTQ